MCRIGADVTFSAPQSEMRQVESETALIKKLKRIVIREVDQGARGAIYGLRNCVEIRLKICDNYGKLRVESAPT